MSEQEPERLRRGGPIRSLQICPRCGAYMAPASDVQGAARGRHWKHESKHRSFGGVKVQVFACERCGHTQTFQVDVVGAVAEDE